MRLILKFAVRNLVDCSVIGARDTRGRVFAFELLRHEEALAKSTAPTRHTSSCEELVRRHVGV
jgi:hypothetical protein